MDKGGLGFRVKVEFSGVSVKGDWRVVERGLIRVDGGWDLKKSVVW